MSRVTDLTCNETMPPSDEKLEPRPGGYRPGGYGLPSTSTGPPRFANQLPKPHASRALYPGSLIPSMSGLPHGLNLPGASTASTQPQKAALTMSASQLAMNSPQTTAAIMALHQQLRAHNSGAAATTQREQQLRAEALKLKEDEEKMRKQYEDARSKVAYSAPSTSTAPPPGIIRPTPTMPGPFGNPMLNSLPSTSSAPRQFNPLASLATHDYMGSSLPPPAPIREPQVKQIPKGGGLVHAPYTPLSKSRMEAQRDPQSSHAIARPIARHADQSNPAAQYALNQAAQAQQEAVQARHKILKEQRDAENAAELQRIQRERQLLLDRQRQDEERQLRAEMNAVAPIVRPAQRGAPNQPALVDPVRLNRAVPPQNNHRLMQHHASNMSSLTTAFANATAAAEQAAARAQKEKEEREAFEKERDMMERAAAEPMQLPPPIHHQSPMHIPSILAGRNNWPKSPHRPGYSPGLNSNVAMTASGMPSFDHLLASQLTNSPYSRLQSLFGVNPPHGVGQHVSPSPSTPQVHATPSPRPSILRRGKNNDASGKRGKAATAAATLLQSTSQQSTSQPTAPVLPPPVALPIPPAKIKQEENIFDYDSSDDAPRAPSVKLDCMIKTEPLDEEDVKPLIHRPIPIRPSYCPQTGAAIWPVLTLTDSPPPPPAPAPPPPPPPPPVQQPVLPMQYQQYQQPIQQLQQWNQLQSPAQQPAQQQQPIQQLQAMQPAHLQQLQQRLQQTYTRPAILQSPRLPSILQQSRPSAKRRLGFDESNPQTVGELATAQLNSGVIGGGLSEPKKIKIEDIKAEVIEGPSTSYGCIPPPVPVSAIKTEPGVPPTSSAEPTPKKRQRKQQFDSNQAPEQIRMQISEPAYMPIMGMHSAEYPGEMLYYQLPPEAPKKKRGRPSSLEKERALIEARAQAQSTTRSIILDLDEPKIVMEKKKGGRKKKEQPPPSGLNYNPLFPPARQIKDEPLEVPFTPPPPRPSSSARPKSAILQAHHAALQLQLAEHQRKIDLMQQQQQQQLQQLQQKPQQVVQPQQQPVKKKRLVKKKKKRVKPKTPPPKNDIPLEWNSDDDFGKFVSTEAREAAKAVAMELGLVGSDGEPRETTPMREAREEAELEEEGLDTYDFLEQVLNEEELKRRVEDYDKRDERELQETTKKEFKTLDRRLRFLSHKQSIVRKFFRKVKGHKRREELSDSEEERKAQVVTEEKDEEKKEDDGRDSRLSKKSGGADSGDEPEPPKKADKSPPKASTKIPEEKEESEVESDDSEILTLTEEELKRLKERGEDFDIVKEVEDSEESEDVDDEEESDYPDAGVERLNLEIRLNSLLEKQQELEEGQRRDELTVEIDTIMKRMDEINEKMEDDVVEDEEVVEEEQPVQMPTEEEPVVVEKKRLIPLDALGDRDNIIRPASKVHIAPSASVIRNMSEKESGAVGKKKTVSKALGFMQLWKRIHSSSENKEGIAVDEPIDVEGDLMRARKRDMMIERAFNKMKKKIAHDRERERIRDEIIEKRRLEKKKVDYKKLDEEGKTIWNIAERMLDTIDIQEQQEKEAKEKEEREKKEQEEKARKEKEEKEKEEKEREEKEKKEKEEREKAEREAKEKEEAERKAAEEKKDQEEGEKKDEDKIDEPKAPDTVTEDPKEDIEKKEDGDSAEIEKADDAETLEKEAVSSDEEEEIADPIERERVQKENEELLRLAVEQVDAKLARKEERIDLAKSLQSYFASPRNSSIGDIDLLSTVAAFQKRTIDEECTREDLEKLVEELLVSSDDDEEDQKDEEKKDDVLNEDEKTTKENILEKVADEIEMEEGIVKMTATRKTRRDISTDEWNSLPSSFHQTEIVDLFGVPFATCATQLVPVVTEEEKLEANEDLLMKHSEETIHQIESGMELKERYQGEDSVARSITRFRRCQAVDNAMMRDNDHISDDIDPDVVEMEDRVIDFLTKSITSTKREAVIEKQIADMDEKNGKNVSFYKKESNRSSIMGNYSVQYDATERLRKGEDEVNDQRTEFARNRFERLRAKRDRKLDNLAESAVTLLEPRQQLPGEWKNRQDAAKERILNKYSKKARSLLLQSYRQFFNDDGQELNAASTSDTKSKRRASHSAKTEPTVLRASAMLKFLEEHDLKLKEIPRRGGSDEIEDLEEGTREIPSTPAEWMNLLKELENAVSESDKTSAENIEVKEEVSEKTATAPVESTDIEVLVDTEKEKGKRRQNESFDLDSIRLIYESGKQKEVKEEKKDDGTDTVVKVEDTPDVAVEKEGEEVDVTTVGGDAEKKDSEEVVVEDKEDDDSDEENSDVDIQSGRKIPEDLFDIFDTEHSSSCSDSEEMVESAGRVKEVEEKISKSVTTPSQAVSAVTTPAKKWSFPVSKKERPKEVILPKETEKTPEEIKIEEPHEEVVVATVNEKTTENQDEVKTEDSQETAAIVDEPKPEEKGEEQKEADDGYEDHLVTMTRGGETITKIVRRPSNAAALMNIPRRIVQSKAEAAKVTNGSPKKKKNGKKTTENIVEKEVNTLFDRVDETLLIDEKKMLNDIQLMKKETKLSKKIQHLGEKWGVTEDDKDQMAKEIEDELEEADRSIRVRSRKESRKESTVSVHSTPNSVEEAIDQAIADAEKKEEEMEDAEIEKEHSDSDWDTSDEESLFKCADIVHEDGGRKEKTKKRKAKKVKAVDTMEEMLKAFPFLKDCSAYQPSGIDPRMLDRRRKLVNSIERKKDAIKPRVYRFRVPPTKKKQQYISPFNSLYENNIPDELANDLEVVKLIMTTNLGDDNITNNELAIMRKKINQTKKGFAEVIKRKSAEPPKAFRDLIRWAIQRGEEYNKREKELKKVQLLYDEVLSGKKTKRSERKAYLKEVKVTREKLNARFGRKFRRSDWSLRHELEDRWKKEHLLPESATPPRMGPKQFVEEMRKTREISDEHARLGVGVADMDHQRKKREARDEKKKEGKGKKNVQNAKETHLKSALRDTVLLFDRLTEEIEYSDDEEINPELIEDKYSDDSLSSTPSSDERQRMERSWTYETVKNSDDDESFVDFGHAHWIGPQVFLEGEELSPTQEETDLVSAPPNLTIPPGAFPEADIVKPTAQVKPNNAGILVAAAPAAPVTPPRPFLTLAQRKAYFTEESEEEKRKKKEAEDERIKKEQEEREELLRIEAEKAAEEKRKEDEKRAEEKRIQEEARREQKKFEGLIGQIDHDTWDRQLQMIIDRVMTTFRRTDGIEYLVRSCKDMNCTERKMIRAIEQWEKEAEEKRVAIGTSEFMSLKSLFNSKSTILVRKGVNVEKKKKETSLPDRVLIEDLVDSMCTFISAHVDDVTLLSELRMTSEKNAIKIRTHSEPPKTNELLVKKSIAAVSLDEHCLVQNTLASTPFNTLTVVGDESSSIVLSASESWNPLISDVKNELLKKDRALKEITVDEFATGIEVFKKPAIPDRFNDIEPLKTLKKNVIEQLSKNDYVTTVLNVSHLRGEIPDVKVLKEGVEEYGNDHQFNFLLRRLFDLLITSLKENGEALSISIGDVPENDVDMKNIIDEGLRYAFDAISAVREEIVEEVGEEIDEEKLDHYLSERIFTNDIDSPLYLVIEDIKKHWERLQRRGIDFGEKSARVFDLSAVGQLERWVEDIFFLSPFSEEGKNIASQLSGRERASLHYQLVLRGEENDDGIVKRIQPVIKMKWSENSEERNEIVHTFAAIPAHQWDSIQRLIKLAKEERKADGVMSGDEETETTVLIPVKSDQSSVVVVEKNAWANEQERIVNTDKFADLELRHSARLLKRKKFGFSTIKAKNAWTRNHNRAYLSGRTLKKIVDGHNVPMKKSTSRNLRQTIRSKAMKNSIKYTKDFNKKQVEILGNPLREKKLKKARKAVRKQKKEIRRHYKRIVSAEIRKHKYELFEIALAEHMVKYKIRLQQEKETGTFYAHLDDERLKEFGITVDLDDELRPRFRRSVKSLSPPPSNQIEAPLSVPQAPINPDTVDDDINAQQDDDPEVDALGNRLFSAKIKKTPSLENTPPLVNEVVENHVDSKEKPSWRGKKPEEMNEAEKIMAEMDADYAAKRAAEEPMLPTIIIESDDDSFDDEYDPEMEQEVREKKVLFPTSSSTATPLHPLKKRVKTFEELSRPLNEREQKILATLMEKRAKGETLVASDDLTGGLKTVPTVISSDIDIGSTPVKIEETDVKMEENHVDVKEELLDQKEPLHTVDDVKEEEKEQEVDLECVLFHSYPERVRKLLAKAIKRREEREEEHTRRYELYRRGVERKMRKDKEQREEKEAEEKEKKLTEEQTDVEKEKEKKENGKSPKKNKKNGEKAKEVEKAEPFEWKAGMECLVKDIPPGFVPMWITKTIKGKKMRIRTTAYKKWKESRMLRRDRVIMGRVSRGRKVPLTRLCYVIDGKKSKALVNAEKEAKKAHDEANNVHIDVDTSNVPITKEILSHFVENQVKSDDARLKMKENVIEDHDATLVKKGFRLWDGKASPDLKEDAEIEKMIEEDKSHERQLETIKEAVTAMQQQAAKSHFRDPVEQLDQEIEEAVENERRVLADYLKMLKTMDTLRYQELVRMWTYDISSDDDESELVDKRWARVRQFVLQKPMGGIKDWESKTAYRDDWGENDGLPKKKEIMEVMGASHPEFKGEQSTEREGYYINEDGFPVKPKKPLHFQPLRADPEYLDNSDINEWCHPDLNERYEADLEKRKIAADEASEDFNIRQREVKQRGLKRTRELMKTFRMNNRMKRKRELMAEPRKEKEPLPMEWTKPQDSDYDSDTLRESFHEYLKKKRELEEKPNTSQRRMPPLGMGMEFLPQQESVFDPMPLRESYWSYVRRTDPTMDIALKRRLEHTREMFAIVVQQMHRTIIVLRETKDRLEHRIETKDLDPEELRRREAESHHDSDESEKDDDEEQTYVLRKRPRLCRIEDEDEDGDDEAEESDRPPSRTDSEREDSPDEEEEEEEEEEEDDEVIEVEVPKKPKKPTLFNRVIKREIPDEAFDLNKVKEEDPEVEAENFINPPIIDVTPKTRKPPTGRKKGRPRKSSDRSDSDSPFYEAPPTSLRRAIGKRPLANDRAAVDFYDEDEQIRLAIEESLKDQPSTSRSGNF